MASLEARLEKLEKKKVALEKLSALSEPEYPTTLGAAPPGWSKDEGKGKTLHPSHPTSYNHSPPYPESSRASTSSPPVKKQPSKGQDDAGEIDDLVADLGSM